jgi:hypothetical protein
MPIGNHPPEVLLGDALMLIQTFEFDRDQTAVEVGAIGRRIDAVDEH